MWRAIYTDDFTVGADQSLQAYNANWSKWLGTGDLNVIAASDDVRVSAVAENISYRYVGPRSPTVNQRIRGRWYSQVNNDDFPGFALRHNGTDGYVLATSAANPSFDLLHYNGGAFDLLKAFPITMPTAEFTWVDISVMGLNPVLFRLVINDKVVAEHAETGVLLTGQCGLYANANVNIPDTRHDLVTIFEEARSHASLAPQQRY